MYLFFILLAFETLKDSFLRSSRDPLPDRADQLPTVFTPHPFLSRLPRVFFPTGSVSPAKSSCFFARDLFILV